MTLSLLVPTVRFDTRAKATLSYLAMLADENISVYIGDNSLNQEKHRFIKELGRRDNVHVFCHDENLGAYGNWLYLNEQAQQHEYACLVSDKNHVSHDWLIASLARLQADSTIASSAGHYLNMSSNGNVRFEGIECMQDTCLERIMSYAEPGWSTNLLIYGVHRKKDMNTHIEFSKNHPVLPVFNDFFHAYTLLSKGKLQRHTTGLCTWDASGWDTAEKNWKSHVSYYAHAGLPESFVPLNLLYCAVDSLHFCMGEYSPFKDHDEALQCGQFLWGFWRQNFITNYYGKDADMFESTVLAGNLTAQMRLRSLMNEPSLNIKDIIDIFSTIMAHFNEEQSQKYKNHVLNSFQKSSFNF